MIRLVPKHSAVASFLSISQIRHSNCMRLNDCQFLTYNEVILLFDGPVIGDLVRVIQRGDQSQGCEAGYQHS